MSECTETIAFGDDYGDNSCTFHCQLPAGHKGEHMEGGNQEGQTYRLHWGRIEATNSEGDRAERAETLNSNALTMALERAEAAEKRVAELEAENERLREEIFDPDLIIHDKPKSKRQIKATLKGGEG